MRSVLFFDLDETLVAQEHAFEEAYRSTADWLARQLRGVDAAALADRIPIAAADALAQSPIAATLGRCRFGGRDLLWGNPGMDSEAARLVTDSADAFRLETWSSIIPGAPADLRALAPELSLRFREAMFDAIAAFPDVQPALDRLAGRYRLAIITNGMGRAQREKIQHLGLSGLFEHVIASTDVGEGKPSAHIFAAALQAMDVPAGEALMVGDSLEADVRGAELAGIRGVWLDRGSDPKSSDAPIPIMSLNELRPSIDVGRCGPE